MPEIEIPQPIKDIDRILNVLCTHGVQLWDWATIGQMIDNELAPAYIQQIASKIAKDGFATESETGAGYFGEPLPATKLGYQITFEGRLFWAQGGYEGQLFREQQEKQKLDQMASLQMELQKSQLSFAATQATAAKAQTDLQARIVKLTIWIAVGTIIAACYYITQLAPYIFDLIDSFLCWMR